MWFPLCRLGDYWDKLVGIRVCHMKEGVSTEEFDIFDISLCTLGGHDLDLDKLPYHPCELENGEWVSIYESSDEATPELTDMRKLGELLVGDARIKVLISRGFKVGYLSEAKLVEGTRQFKLQINDYGISQGSLVRNDSSENCRLVGYYAPLYNDPSTDGLPPVWSKYSVIVVDPEGISVTGCARLKPTGDSVRDVNKVPAHYFYKIEREGVYPTSEAVSDEAGDDVHGYSLSTEHDTEIISGEFLNNLSAEWVGLRGRLCFAGYPINSTSKL